METVEHTKDAWYVSKTGDHQGLVVSEATGENIAVVYDKANAKLIAAAPELLAACKCAELDLYDFVTEWMDQDIETSDLPAAKTWRECKTAIARAEQTN